MFLRICHLYPDLMNIYGDRGNVIALQKRSQWRGIETEVIQATVGRSYDFRQFDIVFFGGAQDKEQKLVCADLQSASQELQTRQGDSLRMAVEDGAVVLGICGGYQLLGEYFRTGEGEVLPGLGIFDAYTVAGNRRMIGDVVVESPFFPGAPQKTLVGFENHSGQTFLRNGLQPIGRAVIGNGNNGQDRFEGAVYKNAFGSYLHGSLLPKNPWFADLLIERALERKYGDKVELASLEDDLEILAHDSASKRAATRPRLAT
ncbi:MAG: glutamine amidotransferase [Firmicutes bacterium]|nr:glutamine amidotransferase [Bacillota bacterium]